MGKERKTVMIVTSAVIMVCENKDKKKSLQLYCAKRHPFCYEKAAEDNFRVITSTDGFLTDEFVFLDRKQAKSYAIKHNQTLFTEFSNSAELYSEDLWPE